MDKNIGNSGLLLLPLALRIDEYILSDSELFHRAVRNRTSVHCWPFSHNQDAFQKSHSYSALASRYVLAVPTENVQLEKRQFAQAAMMRFECSQLVIERIDPLVQPGITPSAHVHQIAGGNSFDASMAPITYDPSKRSNCTSCTFAEDFSNYWTASLYFKARNGTFKRVPQMTNLGLRGKNGGLTVYYIPPYDGKTKVTAFKPVSVSSLLN
jgi:hypothetical protein